MFLFCCSFCWWSKIAFIQWFQCKSKWKSIKNKISNKLFHHKSQQHLVFPGGPSTTQAQCCLTLVIRREPVYSTWYDSWLIFRHNFCIFMCQQQLRFPSNCTKLTNLIKFILMQIKVKINAKFTFCRRLLMVWKSILSMIFTLIWIKMNLIIMQLDYF